ncbi:CRS1_YhbY domain-containing protein [Cephalotus follicularis]|uniref:CRS1_YhbY domain-containing protein n=1 Tax=Cephalotus follicularis TaxID=3775 RepID=A0A1Q3BML7_CEPFO|nr:CRS1_YhbY domain-containing protein [Cephalotus follicularis]
MSFTAPSKLTEVTLRNTFPPCLFSTSAPRPSFHLLRPFSSSSSSSLRTTKRRQQHQRYDNNSNHKYQHRSSTSAPWLHKWPHPHSSDPQRLEKSNGHNQTKPTDTPPFSGDKGHSAIQRIVLRLRNLGLGSDDDDMDGGDLLPVTGDERLGDLLKREWVRPDTIFDKGEEEVLPWEREEEEERMTMRGRTVKAPTLAELTMEDEELRRLRRMGMYVRERISIPKAGVTKDVLDKIHDKWRKEELVRLKFHEVLAHDMKTATEIVQRRTGGLVIWKSGSVMMVYRGSNYDGPSSGSPPVNGQGDALFVPDVSSTNSETLRIDSDAANRETWTSGSNATLTPDQSEPTVRIPNRNESMTEEEADYNSLLDCLGPRFEEWWGTGVLPVDADLLPQKIPGYKTPFRLLPTGMRSRLTNAEMTNLRKLAKSLPCHFALGRNRNHQGLAAAIIQLWEKSLVAKIAVKRGIQNTNNKLMADEIKELTGGVLLLRNKYYIVIYRGKDFLPTSVAATLAERQELTKQIQDVEEEVRIKAVEATESGEDTGQALAGTLAEFYEAQARWGRDTSAEECEKMIEEAAKAKSTRLVKRIEHKLMVAQAKKLRADRILSKIEATMIPAGPDYDQETITDEERVMFRRVGLRMKPYLPLGIRGVFDGVIENMHLHWKHRELVKLISKQKTRAFVEDSARLLEYESGGILVAIERVPKGYALIYYRGKNYQRPISVRPRNLLTKAKALKRSVAMQRHEALSQHISELETTIEQMKKELGVSEDANNENKWSVGEHGLFDSISEFTQSEDEDASLIESEGANIDDDDDNAFDWEAEQGLVRPTFQNDGHPFRKNG